MCFFPYEVNANIICNDGTVSASCGDCHRGCCSRHGGCSSSSSYSSSYSSTKRTKKSKSSSSVAKTTKKAVPAIVKKSGNNKLKKVIIDGKEISLSKSMNYTTSNEKISVAVELESSKASASYNKNLELNHGDNIEKIIVTAENGDEASYELKIKLLSSNIELANVLVNDSKVSISDNMKYYSSEKNATIKVETEDPTTKLEYEREIDLEAGDNIVNIRATSESGKTKDYTLTIKYEEIGIEDYIASTTVLGGAIAGICYAVNKGKKANKNKKNKNSYIECNGCHTLNEKDDKFCMQCGKKLN